MPYLTSYHGNPHSRTHMYGWESEAAVEHARQVITPINNNNELKKKYLILTKLI